MGIWRAQYPGTTAKERRPLAPQAIIFRKFSWLPVDVLGDSLLHQ